MKYNLDAKESVWFVEEALRNGVNVCVAGLDLDSRGVPESTARLLALADEVLKILIIPIYLW